MSEQDKKDCDLLTVAAVEEYARRHGMETAQVLTLFQQHEIISAIRSQYGVLHMLDLDEAADFAEDMLRQAAS